MVLFVRLAKMVENSLKRGILVFMENKKPAIRHDKDKPQHGPVEPHRYVWIGSGFNYWTGQIP